MLSSNPSTSHRVLLLGATGMLGSQILAILQGAHNVEILCIVRNQNSLNPHLKTASVYGDMTQDNWLPIREIEVFEPSVIVHAARVHSSGNLAHKTRAAVKNASANAALVAWRDSYDANLPIWYFSGSLMYGNIETANEDSALSPYAFARAYHRADTPIRNTPATTTFHLPWVLDHRSIWWKDMYYQTILSKRVVPSYSDPDTKMSFISSVKIAQFVLNHLGKTLPPILHLSYPAISYQDWQSLLKRTFELPQKTVSVRKPKELVEALRFSLALETNYPEYSPRKESTEELITTFLTNEQESMNTPTPLSVDNYYDKASCDYDERHSGNVTIEKMREDFRSITRKQIPVEGTVLELGSGTGKDIVWLGAQFPNTSFIALDASEKMLDETRAKIEAANLKNIECIPGEFLHSLSAIPSDSIDFVFVHFGGLNTVEDLDAVLVEIQRVLGAKGRSFITFVNRNYASEYWVNRLKGRKELAMRRRQEIWPGYSYKYPIRARLYSASQLEEKLSTWKILHKKGWCIVHPAWFQEHLRSKFPRLCRWLWKVDRALQNTPLWSKGEYLGYLIEK